MATTAEVQAKISHVNAVLADCGNAIRAITGDIETAQAGLAWVRDSCGDDLGLPQVIAAGDAVQQAFDLLNEAIEANASYAARM
jgi:hypothetical protein